ncbi:LLM class F420-dependent oxidoreductase [Parafrankia colletiae]|uniref:LLM class F420-dependent oxidoreductase n=1 Tax=Parafrankia colletiae TaxID=573497 RepID=A0A1S1QNA0_9ACTN|nr:TIGR03564 family F420-dependent LLM class oxidoreductase [Parafrankia colletiae]MCK9903432.1 TIGR03564 family F420-dependent LLM class oxidoreductase [Frankia sp. Cpl3]OHV35460.1 LLM class F420-dependent oxidoreductase [Parafrankia colletiae]
MRIGITLSDGGGPDALTRLRDDIARAADDGLHSAWLSNIFGLDALTALAVAGSPLPGERDTGIEVGSAVVPTYPRHPVALAQQALTTALAVGGRFTLGIGLSHRVVIEDMLGYSFDRPLRHLSDYLDVLLPLLDGDPVDVRRETVRAAAALGTPRVGRLPVLVAALGPKMLELAGARVDGTVLWMTGPRTIREYIVPTIQAAASTAARPPARVVAMLPVAVTDEPDAARERAAREFRMYGGLPSYRAMLDREGAAGPADVALIGSEESVRDRIAELAGAGVTDFVAAEFSAPDAARTRALLRELAPARLA